MDAHDTDLIRRIQLDLADSYDEEWELELEDRSEAALSSDAPALALSAADKADRRRYFRELFRLQAELVKLQDWVVASRQIGRAHV